VELNAKDSGDNHQIVGEGTTGYTIWFF